MLLHHDRLQVSLIMRGTVVIPMEEDTERCPALQGLVVTSHVHVHLHFHLI